LRGKKIEKDSKEGGVDREQNYPQKSPHSKRLAFQFLNVHSNIVYLLLLHQDIKGFKKNKNPARAGFLLKKI
jgi:hypothetical protein